TYFPTTPHHHTTTHFPYTTLFRSDNQSRKGYQGEEDFYNPEKIQPIKSFWRSHPWPIIASVALVLMIIFASTTIFLLTRSSQSSDRKSTRLNSSHVKISYAVFCLK